MTVQTGDMVKAQNIRELGSDSEARTFCAQYEATVMRLISVLAQETSLLRDRSLSKIEGLQPEKLELTQSFLRQFPVLKSNARFIGARAPVEIDRLRRSLASLDRHIAENATILEATRAVSRGVINAIFEIAEKRNSGPTCYGDNAAVKTGRGTRPTPIAVNRTL